MSTTPDAYHRTEDFESRIDSVLLPDEAWAVFAQMEKAVTVAEISAAIGADTAAVQKQVDLLVQNKLARKKLVNWREFLAQKGINTGPTRMSPGGPQPAPAVLATQARKPEPRRESPAPAVPSTTSRPIPTTPSTTPAAARSATPSVRRIAPRAPEPADPEGTVTFRLTNDLARRMRRASLAMCITFRLEAVSETPAPRIVAAPTTPPQAPVAVPEPEPVLVAAGGGAAECATVPASAGSFAPRKLRSLVDAITRKGGGGLTGQLLVYRVFLRVPPALMFAAGIKSLNLIDDAVELQDERTYDAIRTAARTVASIELDEIAA